jgi:hypothetical protein
MPNHGSSNSRIRMSAIILSQPFRILFLLSNLPFAGMHTYVRIFVLVSKNIQVQERCLFAELEFEQNKG